MDPNELCHHGVKGMKWGVRRTKAQLGYPASTSKKTAKSGDLVTSFSRKRKAAKQQKIATTQTKHETTKPKNKSVSEMSDDELRSKISRLEMEKRYRDLAKASQPEQSKGKKFVMSVLEKSGQNIATQATTYMMGQAVNKAFAGVFNDPAIVNPKKGQKDK